MNLRTFILSTLILLLAQSPTFAQCSGFSVSVSQFPANGICEGDSVALSATSTSSWTTYDWILPNNSWIYNAPIIGTNSATMGINGMYRVIGTSGSCSDTDTVVINVKSTPPFPTISDNTPICAGDTLEVYINTALTHNVSFELYDYNFNLLSYSDTTYIPNSNHNLHSGYYYGVLIDTNGCYSIGNKYVSGFVQQPPKPSITYNPSVCLGDSIKLYGSFPQGYVPTWILPDNSVVRPQLDILTPPTTQTGIFRYIYVYGYQNGCESADTANVTVLQTLSPTVNVTASPGLNVGPYTPVTFTANIADAGSAATFQWVKNGANIPGATNSTLTLTALTDLSNSDKVSVIVNTNNDCATPKTLTSNTASININLGVNDITASTGLRLYPNPVQHKLTVEGFDTDSKISLTGINGITVNLENRMNIDNNKATINTSDLPTGVYILRNGLQTVRFTKAD